MDKRFDYFVVFAEMRTGSNFLEETINAYPGLHCYGEAFNPHFIGHAQKFDLLGVSLADREAEPFRLIERIRVETSGLPGFRFFHDHDPRILERVLADPRAAKIVLTRNPVDSYVSRKIAGATGQWRLSDLKNARSATISFDADEFLAHVDALQAFQLRILHALQISGQTAFYVGYDDLRDIEVMNGLAAWLGVEHKLNAPSQKTKVQNPAALEDKVENFPQMEAALARADRFDLSRTPNFEPRRAPAVPSYVAGAVAPLLYQPVKAGPEDRVRAWLAAMDGVTPAELQTGFTQKTLRQWKRKNREHRSFTVLRHPVVRLHAAFVTHILMHGDQTYWDIRTTLRNTYNLPIPEDAPGPGYSVAQHQEAFLGFARFVQGNLGGQTSVRVDAAWATQTEVLAGFGQFALPDMVLREDRLERDLAFLAEAVRRTAPEVIPHVDNSPVPLDAIYNAAVEAAVKSAYQKDYVMFGFGKYKPGGK